MAFITNKNKPKVTMVAGKVKNMSRGFTVMRNIPKTTATITALEKFATSTPVNTCASTTTATAVSTIFNKNFMSVNL